MTPTRKKLFDQAVRRKRLKFENGKWWAICRDCTGRKNANVYHPVRKRKMVTIEESSMESLQAGVFNCTSKMREKLG